MYKIFGDLTEQIDEPGLTDEQREKENEDKLNELRALSIVADDWPLSLGRQRQICGALVQKLHSGAPYFKDLGVPFHPFRMVCVDLGERARERARISTWQLFEVEHP